MFNFYAILTLSISIHHLCLIAFLYLAFNIKNLQVEILHVCLWNFDLALNLLSPSVVEMIDFMLCFASLLLKPNVLILYLLPNFHVLWSITVTGNKCRLNIISCIITSDTASSSPDIVIICSLFISCSQLLKAIRSSHS